MAATIEKTGKTIAEALQLALSDLGVAESQVDYEVLEEPSKGFFGILGGRPAKIRVTVKEPTPIEKAEKFLMDIFSCLRLDVNLRREDLPDMVRFNLCGDSLGILIGKHGQTLDALQYLVNLAANRNLLDDRVRIVLDVENYRQRREETLCKLAERLADKAIRLGDEIRLEPMNRHERKVIHMALQNNYRVNTYSAGDEPFRYVVIAPKRRSRRREYV